MPFLLAEILNFQGSTHHIGVGSFSNLVLISGEDFMKIIESKTEGKSPGRLSEDILVIMPDFIAVIDGVAPKSNFT